MWQKWGIAVKFISIVSVLTIVLIAALTVVVINHTDISIPVGPNIH